MKSAAPRARAKARAATSARARPARERAVRAPTEAPGRHTEPPPRRPTSWAYAVAGAIAALWTLALVIATAPLHQSGFALLLTVLLALGPTALLLGLAYIVRQGDKLVDASAGPDDQGVAMLGPALRAAAGAGYAADAVQSGLVEAAAAASAARGDMETLRQALTEDRGADHIVTDYVGASPTSLARRLKNEGRDLAARSKALDAQLAQAAEVIDLHVRRSVDAAAAASARFDAADKSLRTSTARLRPAAERAASVLLDAGRLAEGHGGQLDAALVKADIPRDLIPDGGEGLLATKESLNFARQGLLEAVRIQAAALQALFARIAGAAKDFGAHAIDAGEALRGAPARGTQVPEASVADASATGPANDALNAVARATETPPSAAVALRPENRLRLSVSPPVDRDGDPAAAFPTARGIGGQIIFDGSRILIDRTQSASFVMHGAGGQRSIPLREVVRIRFAPPRRGAHGYLQFVLSRGHEGRGGPADVNSILFDPSQQASFQQMAKVLQRAVRHLRRHPDATDPRAPGELAYLMDLRGRGLIDAQEFAGATARMATAKRSRRLWFQRKSKR